MDVTLHKRCAKFVYVIPEGLRELMSDISREVIRSQPDHLYCFIADYLDALMITRENARVAARLVDSIIRIATMTVELLQQTGMTREEADRMANIIQDAFKKFMALRPDPVVYASKEEEEEEEHEMIINVVQQYGDLYDQESSAVEIIQKAFREFKDRHSREKQLLTGMIDWRVAARSAIYLYRKTGVTMEEANRAATLIKAAYKGYYTRRIMKRLMDEGQHIYEERGEEIGEMYEAIADETHGPETLEVSEEEVSQSTSHTTTSEHHVKEILEDIVTSPSSIAVTVLQEMLERAIPDDYPLSEDGQVKKDLAVEKVEEEHLETPPPSAATETYVEATVTTEPVFAEEEIWEQEGEWFEPTELPFDEQVEGEEIISNMEPILEVLTEVMEMEDEGEGQE